MSQSQTPPPGTPRPTTPPAGPKGPTPTGPGRQWGHLPIGAGGCQPLLGQVIRDAERLAAQLISVLERDYDVASAPSAEDDPTGLGFVEVRLMSARADVRSALLMLDQITTLGLPPTGSAVPIPARRDTSTALPGGPPNHLAASSGPGLRLSQRAPDGNGVRPGAGFTLPAAKRIQMDPRSVQSLAGHAAALNESLARRSR